ncbi:hypothetical protein BN946_scf184707.g14 [Trametes cinnabarina]|uniref:Uncharacterized protein n=1 Tax=Pycnoporus cinnabarinus TaxID=5643 RepID=A0A060S7R6_PYCCI|nr:hypothetical protein BN946_scf184707.g14 [Trametes cinnabarina]
MSAGEVAAICVACASVLALVLMILWAWRKRTARSRMMETLDLPSRNTAESPGRSDAFQQSSTHRESLREGKIQNVPVFICGVPAIPPPSTSLAAPSPPPELSPAVTEPSAYSPRRLGGAWDDPPPTPELDQLALQPNHPVGHIGVCAQDERSPPELRVGSPVYEGDGAYLTRLILEEEPAAADLGELPEYSRD